MRKTTYVRVKATRLKLGVMTAAFVSLSACAPVYVASKVTKAAVKTTATVTKTTVKTVF
jgi:hypothetical protein